MYICIFIFIIYNAKHVSDVTRTISHTQRHTRTQTCPGSSGQRVEVRPEERQLFFFCELPQGEQHAVVHLSCVMMDASTKTMLRIEAGQRVERRATSQVSPSVAICICKHIYICVHMQHKMWQYMLMHTSVDM